MCMCVSMYVYVCVLTLLYRGKLDVVAMVTCDGGVGACNINTIRGRNVFLVRSRHWHWQKMRR